MKYIVMECFNSYAVLLDEEGRFVKSANPGYEVGETVYDPVLMRSEPLEEIESNKRRFPKVLLTGLVAVAAAVLLFFGYNFYQTNYVPYSSIFMAINPEVEMVLNRNGEVIDVEGANTDGVSLIEEYDPESDDKVAVANELVDRAIEMGFLAEGGQISFAIDTPNQDLFEQYGVELREEVSGRTSITIAITDAENSGNDVETPPEESPSESEPEPEQQPEEEDTSSDEPSQISLEEAKNIAFDHAGVDGSNADFDDEELSSDDGILYYELEFSIDDDEYEYDIHAHTGNIIDYDHDIEEDDD